MQPQPLPLSSGNLIADRRFEWARDLAAKGDLAGAADLLTQALELAPDYAAAWFALGELREKLGDRDGAVAAFEKARAADPQDRHGARLHLMRLGAAPAGAMPEAYVRALFDGYAAKFDAALTEGLHYRAPELLLRAVEASGVAHEIRLRCSISAAAPGSAARRSGRIATGWSASICRRPCWPRHAARVFTTG